MIKEIKKECLFGLRSGRVFILVMSFLFVAILTPIMLKVVLPEILAWQFPELSAEQLGSMINASQLTSIQGYLSDSFELGLIIVVFTLGGLIAQELNDNTLVLPLISNKKISNIVFSKVIFSAVVMFVVVLLSLTVNFAYSGLLFEFEVEYIKILKAIGVLSIYYLFVISNLMFWGSLLKKTIPTAFMALISSYLIQAIGGLFDIHKYLPSGLIHYTSSLSFEASNVLVAGGISLIVSGLLIVASLQRLKSMELNTR